MKSRQANNCCKRILETTKLAYGNKTKESITSQKLGSKDYLMSWRSPIYASNKAKLFAKRFSKISDLEDSSISLPAFPSSAILKLQNISVTPKMVKKVLMNLDLSKTYIPDCIPVVVLENCEFEFSYTLAEHFNMCLKESCFPDCWKVSSVVSVF